MQIFFSQIFSTIQQEKFFFRKKKKEKLFVQRSEDFDEILSLCKQNFI